MKGLAKAAAMAAIAIAAVWSASCSKDKESGSISFERSAAYFAAEEQATIGFSTDNVRAQTLAVTSSPTGWTIELDKTAMTLSVTAPAQSGDDAAASGSIVLSGSVGGGKSVVSGTLFVGLASTVDFSDHPANSYITNSKETNYLFDATHEGDGTSQLTTARVGIVWQSAASLIQHLQLADGKASFYVGADSSDATKIKEGNALIGAYDKSGNLLYSWHIWVSDFDPEAAPLALNGYTMMSRNLGARANANANANEILASYGLYYQWGRKDPFVGPATYNAANGTSAAMYDSGSSWVYMQIAASDATTGTQEYAAKHPSTFITVAEKDADWLQSTADAGWSNTGKTPDDPCPYGWRVAPAAAFAGLSIGESLDAPAADYKEKYGWTLTDNHGTEGLFLGAGRRAWRDALVHNYFDESLETRADELQPWVGYYWTADATATLASAFCFWLKVGDVSGSGIYHARPMGRANGMQVRCVKTK